MTIESSGKIEEIRLQDRFFAPRININHERTLPTNIERCRETGRIDAFRLNWKEGMPNKPHIFWDSDFAKVVEGMALDLILNPDSEREKELDSYVDLIVSSQRPDGYLNSYFTVVKPEKRWKDLMNNHELYCAGHLMEAAVAHWKATGKNHFLNAMCRYADYIATVFGRAPGQLRGYPGHEEIELALCKLSAASGNPKYLELAKYFIDERGTSPNYFEEECKRNSSNPLWPLFYYQAHIPVREQTEVLGHAVRALYLYCGMADVAAETGDQELFHACERLWKSVVQHKMYVTGGVGSSAHGECVSHDYDLPNESAYAESCASIALVLFAARMLNATGDSSYADVMERALYNGALSGISLDGTHFFYANPIQVFDNRRTEGLLFPVRQPWFGCSCCPTNFCRFIPQLASFAYSTGKNLLRINIPASAKGNVSMKTGMLSFEITGNYPYDGFGSLTIKSAPEGECGIAFRIPDWCKNYSVKLNGIPVEASLEKGYLIWNRIWNNGDILEWNLEMKVAFLHSHPLMEENAGRMVLRRGPLLYVLEGVDNGAYLSRISIPEKQDFILESIKGLPDGVPGISGKAFRDTVSDTDSLYSEKTIQKEECVFHAIPYALWQNRGKTSMILWVRSC